MTPPIDAPWEDEDDDSLDDEIAKPSRDDD